MFRLPAILLLLLSLLAAGCVSVDEEARQAMMDLHAGKFEEARRWSEELATESHYTKRLGKVEAGRINMLGGDLPRSESWFRQALDEAIERNESGSVIKLSDVGNTVLASTVTDDRTMEYYLQPYEINLALEYAILVQEALGKREDALVDARLAVYVQDTLAETYGADIAKRQESAAKNGTAMKICREADATMMEAMMATRNSWENPVLWWLTGVLFEANGEKEMALQSYRKAAAILPENTVFANDLLRAEKGVWQDRGKARLAIVCQEGLVPMRQSLKVPVPVYTGMAIDIPVYKDERIAPRQIAIREVSDAGKGAVAASPGNDIQALAYRDLKERLPGIVVRNLTRCATAAAAQAAVNSAGNDYAQIGMIVANSVAAAIRRADTRSWRSLPVHEQVWSDNTLSPGDHDFLVDFGAGSRAIKVNLKAGETKIIYVSILD